MRLITRSSSVELFRPSYFDKLKATLRQRMLPFFKSLGRDSFHVSVAVFRTHFRFFGVVDDTASAMRALTDGLSQEAPKRHAETERMKTMYAMFFSS
jgi:hypothetical protein